MFKLPPPPDDDDDGNDGGDHGDGGDPPGRADPGFYLVTGMMVAILFLAIIPEIFG